MADDLGYDDIGCYGQEKIRTPNIDRLAAEGMRFTQHYSGSPVCAPSRCVLMTGKHPDMPTSVPIARFSRKGRSRSRLPKVTLAELLKAQGYATGAFGKCGLGYPESEGDPLN